MMEFTVEFEVGKGFGHPIQYRAEDVGLSGLYQAREATRIPDLAPALVDAEAPGTYINPKIDLSVEQAEQTGHFKAANYVAVKVPAKALNGYAVFVPVVHADPETGEVKRVSWRAQVDEKSILEQWLQDGAPLEWEGGA